MPCRSISRCKRASPPAGSRRSASWRQRAGSRGQGQAGRSVQGELQRTRLPRPLGRDGQQGGRARTGSTGGDGGRQGGDGGALLVGDAQEARTEPAREERFGVRRVFF